MAAVHHEFGPFEMSHAVFSAPEGFESDHEFMNIGMMFASDLEPEEVLDRLQAIEKNISPDSHRNPDGTYRDRRIDIDIIAADDRVITTERLTLPHPRLAERRFFLAPLEEIAPGWRHPQTGLTPAAMLARLDS